MHTFWKLDKKQNIYTLVTVNPDTIEAILKDNPKLVKYEVIENGRPVLTDTPENLQKFLIAGLTIEEFYGDVMELKPLSK